MILARITKERVQYADFDYQRQPQGKNSTTYQTALYLQALHPEHTFATLHAGQQIKRLEQDFSPARKASAA